MGNRNRSAFGNLFFEIGDDRTVATEHIAKASGNELGTIGILLDEGFEERLYISAIRLLAPMILVGLTALSVEIITNRFTPYLTAISAIFLVPITFARTASLGWDSISGTCL